MGRGVSWDVPPGLGSRGRPRMLSSCCCGRRFLPARLKLSSGREASVAPVTSGTREVGGSVSSTAQQDHPPREGCSEQG